MMHLPCYYGSFAAPIYTYIGICTMNYMYHEFYVLVMKDSNMSCNHCSFLLAM